MENKNTTLNIAIASDDNYAMFVSVVIASLLDTNKDFEKIVIHYLINNVNSKTISRIESQIRHHKNVELAVYDISDINSKLQIDVPSTISISAYSRLFLSSILPEYITRLIYVDCDIIFNNSIKDFYNEDIDNYLVAGILDTLPDDKAKVNIGLNSTETYINSGVLLINLALWRKMDIQTEFVQFLLDHNGNVYHHDQGIINAVCNNKKKIVSPKYNLTSNYLCLPYNYLKKNNNPFYSQKEVSEAIINPSIIHYTEGYLNRPWIENCSHPFVNIFEKYLKQTDWKSFELKADRRSPIIKFISWVLLHCPFICFKLVSYTTSVLVSLKKLSYRILLINRD